MSKLPLAVLGGVGGFASDPRFAGHGAAPPAPPPEDPLALAWADGHAAGFAEASAEAALRREQEDQARARIELALARLDADQAEMLRQRLVETVTALCEAALAPLALDAEALADRAARAAAMLARSDDAAVLRLHPDDVALIEGRLPAGLPIEPDPALERGALRLEGAAGGIEDGPARWRRALAEALGPC